MRHSLIRSSLLLGLFALTPACSDKGGDDTGTGGSAGTGATGGSGGSDSGSGGTGGSAAGTGATGGSSATGGGAGMSSGGSAGTGVGGMAGGATCGSTFATTVDQNYQFTSTLTIMPTPVKSKSEITFDWSGVKTDFLGRPVDLNNVDMVEISLWEMTLDEFEKDLNDDKLANPIVIGHIPVMDGQTSGSIWNLTVPAGQLDIPTITTYLDEANYPPANHLYAVMVASGEDYGQGTFMLGSFTIDPAATNQQVTIDSNSTKVDFMATIASRAPTYIPAGTGAVTIDWTKQKLTASGGEFIPSSITRLRIGHYTQTPEELQGQIFLQLDEVAQEMYEATVEAGTKISFDQAKNIKDMTTPFAGIDNTGTWIVALNCGACQNPAPWYLSVLKPCP
jgi:hypothetical protein